MRPCIGALHWPSPSLTTVLLSHCKPLLINMKVKGQRPIMNGKKCTVELEERYSERSYWLSDGDRRYTHTQEAPGTRAQNARMKAIHALRQ